MMGHPKDAIFPKGKMIFNYPEEEQNISNAYLLYCLSEAIQNVIKGEPRWKGLKVQQTQSMLIMGVRGSLQVGLTKGKGKQDGVAN